MARFLQLQVCRASGFLGHPPSPLWESTQYLSALQPVWLSSLGLPSSDLLQVLLYINSGITSLFSTLHLFHPQSSTSSSSPAPLPVPSLPAQILSSELTS